MGTTAFHSGTGTALAAIAIAALLSGCTESPPAIPGLTYAERKTYVARERDRYWHDIGLRPGTRPIEIDPVEYVDEEIWGHTISTCIIDLPETDFGTVIRELVREQPERDREYVRSSLEWWVCQGLYPLELDDITLLSSEELTALYEHYELFTVPCLAAKGYRLHTPLERGSFTTEGWPAWSPIDSLMTRGIELERNEYVALATECRAFPERFFGTPWWEQEEY